MIVLLIADDEKTTRESLCDLILADEFGIDRVLTAKNGMEALELAGEAPPDILLTDIRMPKMDGIELSNRVLAAQPNCKIIFISGYSDKEYLKSAIHLKAVSYIEKPLNIDEIKSAVAEAVALCLSEKKKLEDNESLKSQVRESMPLVTQEAAIELIKDNVDIAGLAVKYRIPFLKLAKGGLFSTACFTFNWGAGLDCCGKNEAQRTILDRIGAEGPPFGPCIAGATQDDRMLFVSPGELDGEKGTDLLRMVMDVSGGKFTASVGIGRPAAGMNDIPASYRSSVECVKMQFYDGFGKTFRTEGAEGTFQQGKSLASEIKKSLRIDRLDDVARTVRDFTESAREAHDRDLAKVKNAYFNLLLHAISAAREQNLIGIAEEHENSYIWMEIERIRFLSDVADYLMNNILAMFSRSDQGAGVNAKIHEIQRYIQDNMSSKNLSVQSIADSAYLSQAYLCTFYKKMTGKTLNDYITDVRMEKAVELLRDRRNKLVDVVSGIGLTNTDYFSTLFKKYTGCTPSEFRGKN